MLAQGTSVAEKREGPAMENHEVLVCAVSDYSPVKNSGSTATSSTVRVVVLTPRSYSFSRSHSRPRRSSR